MRKPKWLSGIFKAWWDSDYIMLADTKIQDSFRRPSSSLLAETLHPGTPDMCCTEIWVPSALWAFQIQSLELPEPPSCTPFCHSDISTIWDVKKRSVIYSILSGRISETDQNLSQMTLLLWSLFDSPPHPLWTRKKNLESTFIYAAPLTLISNDEILSKPPFFGLEGKDTDGIHRHTAGTWAQSWHQNLSFQVPSASVHLINEGDHTFQLNLSCFY